MGLLQRLGHDIARGHGKALAVEAGIRLHHHHLGRLPHRFLPHQMLLLRVDAESFQFAAAAGGTGPPLHAPITDQIEGGDALGYTRGMIEAARHEHDAMAQPDLACALAAGG